MATRQAVDMQAKTSTQGNHAGVLKPEVACLTPNAVRDKIYEQEILDAVTKVTVCRPKFSGNQSEFKEIIAGTD
jgi:hypothetical protein